MTGFTVPSLSDIYCACCQKTYLKQLDPGWSKTEHSFMSQT